MRKKLIFTALFLLIFLVGFYNSKKTLPTGLSFEGELRTAENLKFLRDITWTENNLHKTGHEIFDAVLENIHRAENLILIDMFLFNDFSGDLKISTRKISNEIKEALIQKKLQNKEIEIILITDPINTVYGGLVNPLFEELKKHQIRIVFTNLDSLRDSNPIYSSIWRTFISHFKNSPGSLMKNPFGYGRVSIRSYLKLLNFKANHRKIIVTDSHGELHGIVSSANPHDASILNSNAGVSFSGKAVLDLIKTEIAVLKLSGEKAPDLSFYKADDKKNSQNNQIKIITEKKILKNILMEIESAEKGDSIDIVLFYLSHTKIIDSLVNASKRGVDIRVLLDSNKDAFGMEKNGIPNRVTANILHANKIKVKWAVTNGEQMHTKLILIKKMNSCTLICGSANYTRRNLNDLNLETDILVKGSVDNVFFKDSLNYVNLLWNNTEGKKFSADFDTMKDSSNLKKALFYFMEYSGISTF